MIFFEKGFWQKIIVDDKVPCDIKSYEVPLFMNSSKGNLGPLILEKAYAKYTRCFYNFHRLYPNYSNPEKWSPYKIGDTILYRLTGFVSIEVPTFNPNNHDSKEEFKNALKKYYNFKIRLLYPN